MKQLSLDRWMIQMNHRNLPPSTDPTVVAETKPEESQNVITPSTTFPEEPSTPLPITPANKCILNIRCETILICENMKTLLNTDTGNASYVPENGWMYEANGVFPDVGCSRTLLQNGDIVQWPILRNGKIIF